MARGVDGRDIFIDDIDRHSFLEIMRRLEREAAAEVIAYCLMGNHFHLAVKVECVPLAVFMQRLLTAYCQKFNLRHERTGHLFQARYKAILCLDDRYLAGLVHYIHVNPVRAGLVVLPQDWPWSSFASAPGGPVDNCDFNPWPGPLNRDMDLSRSSREVQLDLNAVGSEISFQAGIDLNRLRSNSRDRKIVEARRLFVGEAFRGGHALIAVAKWLNMSPRSVSRYASENTVRSAGLTPIG